MADRREDGGDGLIVGDELLVEARFELIEALGQFLVGSEQLAQSGVAASAFRSSMRLPSAPVRDLTKYTTDAALRAAAGRANPRVTAVGAGMAAAGAYGATAGCR